MCTAPVEKRAWPVRYMTMFHMTNDSHQFWSRQRLQAEDAYPSAMSHWRKGESEWLPLYEGKMVQAFDHRAADVVVHSANIPPSSIVIPGKDRGTGTRAIARR